MNANHNHMCILTSSVTIQGVTEGDLSLIIHFIKFGIILFVVPNYVVEGDGGVIMRQLFLGRIYTIIHRLFTLAITRWQLQKVGE